jgi:hypothetical protein
VQSAAAVVAIVGGLIATRLVTLSAERGALKRRHAEAEEAEGLAVELRQRRATALDRFKARYLWRAAESDIFNEIANKQLVDWQRHVDEWGWDPSLEMIDENLVPRVELLSKFHAAIADGNEVEFTSSQTEPSVREMLGRAEQAWRPQRRTSPFDVSRISLGVTPLVNTTSRDREQADLEAELRGATDRLRVRQAETSSALHAMQSLGRPEGTRWAFGILAYVALVGIVAPLAVMSAGHLYVALWVRLLLVGAFSLGLVAFLLHLVVSAERSPS